MRSAALLLAVASLLATGGLAGCGDSRPEGAAGRAAKIGVILPDGKSSARWESADRRYLEAAFRAAGVAYDIQNAQSDKQQFQTIADQMITNGATVLMIINLDSGTGKAVLDHARTQGVATIDYDRLTLGGSASYYVSFDNIAVGRLQGEGLTRCLAKQGVQHPVIAELNGSPTDNNASQFKRGYDAVLGPKYASGEYVKGPDQWVPGWDTAQGATIFEQMFTSNRSIAGVLAANDNLANSAITVLRKNQLTGKVPVTGQDATLLGLQNVLLGNQCMTVYKAIRQEAEAAAALAVSLARGERRRVSQSVNDPKSNRNVPAVLLEPKAIYAENVREVISDGFVTAGELCTGEVTAVCASAGIR